MLRKRFIQVSWLITLMAISYTGFAQDTDGFYVIPFPVPTDEVVEVEVCNGAPIGNVVFTIAEPGTYVYPADVYPTTNGYLVEITGTVNNHRVRADGNNIDFRVSPNTLPPPTDYGVKGPYYFLDDGNIAYARFL